MTLSQAINLLLALVFVYLTSFVDQAIFLSIGLPPLVGQLICLVALLGCLSIDLVAGKNRSFSLSLPQLGFLALTLAYMGWTAISFVYSSQSPDALQVLITRLKAGLFMAVVVPLFSRVGAANALGLASVGLAVFGSVLTIYDFLVPTFSSVPGRGAGFYINPNDTGYMLVALAVVASSRLGVARNYMLWALVIAGVVVTFSRSGWLLLTLALGGQAWLGRLGGGRGRYLFVGTVAVLLSGLFLAYVSGALYGFVAGSGLASHLDPNTVVRLGAHGAALDDASALQRHDALFRGLEAFYSSPFIGHGVGYTNEWDFSEGPHNMYVLFLAELGIVGFCLFCSLLAVAILREAGAARLLGLCFAFASLFSHNMLDPPGVALMLALAISGAPRTQNKQAGFVARSGKSLPKRPLRELRIG